LLTVLDVRPLVAYNGWRRNGEARGGHIPGAVALPTAWLDSLDEFETRRLLDAKRIVSGRDTVIYGHSADDARALAQKLEAVGIEGAIVYEGGALAWAADEALPLERLPNYDKLVDIEWLREVLDGQRPEAAPEGGFLLFHVNSGGPEEYAQAHIPGASYLDTNWLEDPVGWNRRSPGEIERAVIALGITKDTTVVVYGRDTDGEGETRPGRRAGQIAAARALLILRCAGVDDVRLLDGGFDRWVRAGNRLETVGRSPIPVASFGARIPVRPEIIVDIEDAKAILADQEGSVLVSVRTWREHIGDVDGYDDSGPAGRIKGDVWGNCGTDAYHMEHYRNIDNTMRAYPEIAANWAATGITPDKRVAFYCGTGWRASETWFCAYLQGWEQIAVYDGGWFEWRQDPINNPIETGEPEGSSVPAFAMRLQRGDGPPSRV